MKITNTSATSLLVDGVGVVKPGETAEVSSKFGARLCETANWTPTKKSAKSAPKK